MRARTFAPLLLALLSASCASAKPTPAPSPVLAPHVTDAALGIPQIAAAIPAPPIGLTTSDGTGLRLSRLTARAVVEGPLALTELHLDFENPNDRVLEGRFHIALPQGAALSRFAMKLASGEWQEGEVVELAAARVAYEDFLHRRQDPALLEKGAGNEFTARVFPIPARGTKEIIVTYSQELTDGAPYTLPLRGLPEMKKLDVSVFEEGQNQPAVALVKENVAPAADVVFTPPSARPEVGLRSGDLVAFRIKPVEDAQLAPDPIGSAVILFDTSASRALGFEDEIRALQRIVLGVGKNATVSVACFDQTTELVYEGEGGGFDARAAEKIRTRQALGASDVGQALAWAKEKAKKSGATRVIVISDGVATAGATEGEKLGSAARALGASGVERVDAVAVGGIRDDAALKRLVATGLARDGVVVDGTADAGVVARKLTRGTRSGVAIRVDGATFSYPKKVDGVQPGDEVVVYAELPEKREATVSVNGATAKTIEVRNVERPLLERSMAAAKIASLLASPEPSEATKKQIVELSVNHRVLSPYTGMLVLETEQDYDRFHIERTALCDVLTIDGAQIARVHRAAPVLVPEQAQRPPMPANTPVAGRLRAIHAVDEDGAALQEESDRTPGALPPPPSPVSAEAPVDFSGRASGPVATATASAAPPPAQARVAAEPMFDARPPPPAPRRAMRQNSNAYMASEDGGQPQVDPYTGRFKVVMETIAKGDAAGALAAAKGWHDEEPGDVMALVAMGEAYEALSDVERAARAYGSIIDLFPSRADLRRFAGERLERLKGGAGDDLALDTFAKAKEERPDHPASHRLLAYERLKHKDYKGAFEAAADGVKQHYPAGRFLGVETILQEDLGLIAAAWIKAEPQRRARDPEPSDRGPRQGRGRAVHPLRAPLGDRRQRRGLPHPRRQGQPRLLRAHGARDRRSTSTPTSPPATAPSASPSASPRTSARRPTSSRRITSPAAPWATEWASSRSSSTTARAASPSTSAPTS